MHINSISNIKNYQRNNSINKYSAIYKNNCYNSNVQNAQGLVMFAGKYNNLVNTLKQFAKEFDIDQKTIAHYKKYLTEVLAKEEPKDFEFVKNAKITPGDTSFVLNTSGVGGKKEFVKQTINLEDATGVNIAYYSALYDLKGNIFDNCLTIY